MKKLSNEQILEVILKAGLLYDLAGFENEVEDGFRTQESFKEMLSQENIMSMVDYHIHDARTRRKYITSPNTQRTLEIKHINFLGNETIDKCKQIAVEWAIKKFS